MIFTFFFYSNISQLRPSIISGNNRGGRGKPFFIPLPLLKKPIGAPFAKITKWEDVTHAIIQLTTNTGIQIWRRFNLEKPQSNLSKCFSRSIFSNIAFIFFCLTECTTSYVISIVSKICLSCKNPNFSKDKTLDKECLILKEIIFEMSL